MEITKKIENNELTLFLSGRLDTTTASQLEAEVNAIDEGVTKVVFDLENLEYISSAGLRVLLMCYKKNQNVTIVKANEMVQEVFEMTGISNLIPVK